MAGARKLIVQGSQFSGKVAIVSKDRDNKIGRVFSGVNQGLSVGEGKCPKTEGVTMKRCTCAAVSTTRPHTYLHSVILGCDGRPNIVTYCGHLIFIRNDKLDERLTSLGVEGRNSNNLVSFFFLCKQRCVAVVFFL